MYQYNMIRVPYFGNTKPYSDITISNHPLFSTVPHLELASNSPRSHIGLTWNSQLAHGELNIDSLTANSQQARIKLTTNSHRIHWISIKLTVGSQRTHIDLTSNSQQSHIELTLSKAVYGNITCCIAPCDMLSQYAHDRAASLENDGPMLITLISLLLELWLNPMKSCISPDFHVICFSMLLCIQMHRWKSGYNVA